ncbi:sulfatase-like hydrolase/transferase, partial [Candidatus Poribacteria bacterium]|nr:sulfatase-like hydrolase/transferase [Candidatus Poribacteria bacterium]
MNIVLIIIDTLRYDYVGANGNPNISTPNLDRLAAESWVFDRAFSASFPTIPFRNDVMRGQYGGPFHPWKPLPFNAPAFPRILGDNGYATQLIHDTPHLVNGGHNFDWPFHGWTFIRGAEVDRPWITDGFKLPDNWA